MARPRRPWYEKQARRIILAIKDVRQEDIAKEISVSQQTVSYRLSKVYPEMLEDLVRILDMAGYEICEKGD